VVFHAVRQELRQRRLIEKGVAPREEKAVVVPLAGEGQLHLPLVHARADGPDPPVGAKLSEHGEGPGERRLVVLVRIVDEDDVDTLDAQPLERRLERRARTLSAEIERPRRLSFRAGAEHAAHLGRQHIAVTRNALECLAIAPLTVADPVHRRRVEIVESEIEAPPDQRHRFGFR
jgi:hypothetical protein